MNISNNFKIQQPNFKGAIPKALMEPIENSKVSKGLTKLDIACFRQYLNSRQYRMGILPTEIKELEKFEGDDFLMNSYKLILKKMGIPEEIAAPINIVDKIGSEGEMAYMPVTNMLLCDKTKIGNNTKLENFALLRHECQHYAQNMAVLRHETIGEKAIETMTQNYIKMEKESLNNLINTYSDEELKELFVQNPAMVDYVSKARQYIMSGDTQSFDTLLQNVGEVYKSSLINLQAQVRTKMGIIPKDSPLTTKVEKYYEELSNIAYHKGNTGNIDYAKYLESSTEQEAMNSQFAAMTEYAHDVCPVNLSKEEVRKLYEDENLIKKIDNDLEQAGRNI
ncbi:MAG: hypothetical protein ACI4S3_02105 [Candidatus Gastranaerophilaceae bacterium]